MEDDRAKGEVRNILKEIGKDRKEEKTLHTKKKNRNMDEHTVDCKLGYMLFNIVVFLFISSQYSVITAYVKSPYLLRVCSGVITCRRGCCCCCCLLSLLFFACVFSAWRRIGLLLHTQCQDRPESQPCLECRYHGEH